MSRSDALRAMAAERDAFSPEREKPVKKPLIDERFVYFGGTAFCNDNWRQRRIDEHVRKKYQDKPNTSIKLTYQRSEDDGESYCTRISESVRPATRVWFDQKEAFRNSAAKKTLFVFS